jgi:geranylgeranyl diphosphate synthase, type I
MPLGYRAMPSFQPDLATSVQEIDAFLASFLDSKREELPEARSMIDEIARSISAGGKRLRPCFCYWGYRAAGGEDDAQIVAAASSLELLHTFALVHDDIMDLSHERRGLPTSYSLHGTDVALLVGDLALVLADAALMESGFEPVALRRAFDPYSRMRQQVIAGQYLDVVAARDAEMSVERARRIAVLKSGKYTIQEPLAIGAALAGAGRDLMTGLEDFGGPLGEAFQLRDDLLGSFGDSKETGKPADSDIRQGKRHVLYAFALEVLEGSTRESFQQRWGGGDSLGSDDIAELKQILVESGARSRCEDLLRGLRDRALAVLDDLDVDAEVSSALKELTSRATDRVL